MSAYFNNVEDAKINAILRKCTLLSNTVKRYQPWSNCHLNQLKMVVEQSAVLK